MMLFQISYNRFLDEIRHEKIEPGDINQLEVEEIGNLLAYYLTSITRKIAFVFVVEKSKITDVQKLQLDNISKPSRRIRDSVELSNISDTLARIEQNLNKLPTQKVIK